MTSPPEASSVPVRPADDDAATDVADASGGDASSGTGVAEQDGRGRRRRRIDRGLLLASLIIAAGVVLIVWGFVTARTGDDGIDRPDAIEDLSPVENAVQVLQQEAVRVDLLFGYEAVLVIDDVELPTTVLNEIETEPGAQIDLPPTAILDVATGVISFQPSDGAPIKEFTEGRHDAEVIYWKAVDGRDSARSYGWHLTVI